MTTQLDELTVQGAVAPCTVRLSFTDGESCDIEVGPEETVLAAGKAAGYNIAAQCAVGTCGTCVATLRTGTAEMSAGVSALTREEVAAGQRLLCRTHPKSDAELHLDYPSTMLEANPPLLFTAKVARLTWVADSVVELQVRLPKSMRLTFTAGQYSRIRIPGTDEWRSYSMASGEHERTKLTFLIRVLPEGAMSDFLRNGARPGEVLEMEGPLGGFVLDPSPRPHLLIAGGTGVAPMLSMLDRIRLVRPAPPVQLVFGAVRPSELFLLDELEARTSFMPNLSVRVVVEEGADGANLMQGNPVSALTEADAPAGAVAYLCGPPGMIRAATERLSQYGIAADDIRAENFLAS